MKRATRDSRRLPSWGDSLHGILREALGMAACVTVAIPVLMLTATGVQGANPAGPDIAGTWNTTAPIANPTYSKWTSGNVTINSGVTVTIADGSTITFDSGNNRSMGVAGGVFEIDGTFLHASTKQIDPTALITVLDGGVATITGAGAVWKVWNDIDVQNNGTIRVNLPTAADTFQIWMTSASTDFTMSGGLIDIDRGILDFDGFGSAATVNGVIDIAAEGTLQLQGGGSGQYWGTTGLTIQGAGLTQINGNTYMNGGLITLGTTGTNTWSSGTIYLNNGGELRIPAGTTLRRTGSGVLNNSGTGFMTVYGTYEVDAASSAGGTHRVNVENGGTWSLELAHADAVKFGVVTNDTGGTIEVSLADDALKCGFSYLGAANGGGLVDIRDGSTIRVLRGELEIGTSCDTSFNGAAPGSTLNFNVYLTNSTLDIQDLTSGIATIGSGATLTMRGANAKFMDVASDVIQGDLATVNGTFRFDNGFSLTPGGGGTLTVSSSGTFGADGALSGNLSCAGAYRAEVAGGDADLLTVNGTVTLTGSPTLTIAGTADGTSNQYILIDNDGTDAVVGTFANSTVEFSGRTYNISYTMGTDNNDVGITFIQSGTVFHFR